MAQEGGRPSFDEERDALDAAIDEQAELLDDAVTSQQARRGLRADIAIKGGGVYAVAPSLFAERVARIHSPLLTQDGGDPSVVARYLSALGGLVKSLDPHIIMQGLHFIASVDVTLSPEIEPEVRKFALDQARRHPERKIQVSDLPLVIPPSVLSLEAAGYLLALDPGVISERSAALGTAPRERLRVLSRRLAEDGASIELRGASPTIVVRQGVIVADNQKLHEFAEELTEPHPVPSITITVYGRLTVTNAETNEFRVVLDRRRLPPELDGRRSSVEGPYSTKAGDTVRREGLWDSMVRATVLVELAGVPGRRPKPTKFTFMDIEPAGVARPVT